MKRNWFITLAVLLWVAPLAVAFRYWQVWDQLPVRMASHFDAAGHANGWMTRETSLQFTLGFMAFMLVVFCGVLYAVAQKYPLGRLAWSLLAFFHLEIWMIAWLMNSIVDYNLGGSLIQVAPFLVVTPFAIVVLIIVALTEKRGEPLPVLFEHEEPIAEEVHNGRGWSFLFLIPLAVIALVALLLHDNGLRIVMGIVAIVMISAFGMAWDGFHYYFTRHGVEIRTLGFRVKSIPSMQIKNYEVGGWSALGGYGIRGMGNRKAYVWGNKGVRIEMFDGQVFLGHSDPERIVHDLDVMKSYQHS